MDLQDKERFDRLRETLGDWCGIVELAQVEESDAVRWVIAYADQQSVRFDPDAARELVDALGADMMLIASEVEKLLLYVTAPRTAALPDLHLENARARITLGDVETMVLAAKQRSLYELTDAITAHDRPRAIALLHGLLNASDGGEDAAIGHLYMLARTFRQMLIILEKNVRDSRAIWQALWQGFRMPPFAAEDIIRQARRYKSRRDLTRAPPPHRPRRSRSPQLSRVEAPRPRTPRPRPRHRPRHPPHIRTLPAIRHRSLRLAARHLPSPNHSSDLA